MTALHIAAKNGKLEAAEALLEGGADPGIADNKGRKPINLTNSEDMRSLLRNYQ